MLLMLKIMMMALMLKIIMMTLMWIVDFLESHLGECPPPAGTTPLVAIADIEMAVNIVCNKETWIKS